MSNEHQIWQAMAEHFLDTETRHLIPHTAWLCHQFMLTCEEIDCIWAYDVTPALYWNLYDIAGQWAGWDAQWLVARIEAKRIVRWRSTKVGWWIYKRQIGGMHAYIQAIIACRMLFWRAPEDQRERLYESFFWLAKVYFDMTAGQIDVPADDLRALFYGQFLTIFQALTDDHDAALVRINAALAALNS